MLKQALIFISAAAASAIVFTAAGCFFSLLDKPLGDGKYISENDFMPQTEGYTEMTTEESTALSVKSAEITFTGDLMVHQWQMDDALSKGGGSYSFDYTFEPVYDYLKNTDLTVGNLETVFAGEAVGYSDYPNFNTPDEFLSAIKNAGFDVLTTANNHCMDKGIEGAFRTIDLLDQAGIGHFGTYKSQEERDSVFIKEVNGIKIAFVSATYGVNGNYYPEDMSYAVNILDTELITEDIKRAKAENPDFIVAMPHLGNEYESYPKQVFKDWIDIMIKAGADAVIASHPHILQPMEMRTVVLSDGSEKTAFVAYSMANFISSQRTEPRDTGVIVKMKLKKSEGLSAEIEEISYIPTWVQWRDTTGSYNIRVLSIYDALKDISEGKNTYGLREADIKRLKAAQSEATLAISGESISAEEIKEKYYIIDSEES